MRCADCLDEFRQEPRYAVIKEDKGRSYSAEERQLAAHLYPALVCRACAGWYDDALPAPPAEQP